MAAAGTCLPQEVPGLANIEILKIVPRRPPNAALEPLLPMTPTAADRRYDVMIDFDDDYYDEDDSQYTAVDTTLERPQPLPTTDLSDYDLTPFQPDVHLESDFENVFAKEILHSPSSPSREFLAHPQGFEEEALGSPDTPLQDKGDQSVAINENIDPHTEDQFIIKEQERLDPVRERRLLPRAGDTLVQTSRGRQLSNTKDRFIPSAEEHFLQERRERFIPGTRNRFVPVTNESVIYDTKGRFVEGTDNFSVLSHETPAPDGLGQNPLPRTDGATVALVTEGSMQYARVVPPPPYNPFPNTAQRRIGAQYLVAHPTTIPQRAPYHPNQHQSGSVNTYFNDAQHLRRVSPLSASLQELYQSRDISKGRSSRALYSHAQHQQEGNPSQSYRPQVPPLDSRPAARDTRPTITEKNDNSFLTNRQDRSLSVLNPSYEQLVAAQQNVKRDRVLQDRPPAGAMSRDEVAYYTGLQQEIEKSDLLVDAIKDVRSREGKSIEDLKRRRKDTDGPEVVTTPAPDIQEVKQEFGSHPLYEDLPREAADYLGVKAAGPLLHRDDYSSERDEYEKMYLPVRAKSLELREIRKVKEHFHSLVPLKALKNSHSSSAPRRKPQTPAVTTYKPPVLPEYIKYHKPTSVATAKPYYKSGTSYNKYNRNTIPPPPLSSKQYSREPTELGPPHSRAPPPKPFYSPKVSTKINPHSPRRSTASSDHRTKDISHLFYPNAYTSPSVTPSTHRSQRSSRMYRPQEQDPSSFRRHHSRDIKTHRLARHLHETPSSAKASAHGNPSSAAYSLPDGRPGDTSSALHAPTPAHHPALETKVRRKRGPDMEDYIDSKVQFPRYGYDIDPYFSDFPKFGFFDSDGVKGS